MPKWIHDRADHIRGKNPGMPKSLSFAIATQQAHATGKTPKDYGTEEGKQEAKQKYDEPKREYELKADPSHKTKYSGIDLVLWKGFGDELLKIAAATSVQDVVKSSKSGMAKPKMTSKPVVKEPDPPASTVDQLGSARTIQPPPVTAGGFN
jgi:hypothetical protein